MIHPTSPARLRCALWLGMALGWLLLVAPLTADEAERQPYAIAATGVESALRQFYAQSGQAVIAPSKLIATVTTHEVRGTFTPREALDAMFAGTPITAIEDPTGAFALVRRPAAKTPQRVRNASALIVVGLAADSAQGSRFQRDAAALSAAFESRGVPAANIQILAATASAPLRRDAILAAARAGPASVEESWLVLIGHAAPGRSGGAMFQINGPRFSAEDLVAAANTMAGKRYVIVGTTKGGAFLAPLLMVPEVEAVAATASSGEINEPRFVAMWAAAMTATPDASFAALAAAAAGRVRAFYRQHEIGESEHAQILDRASRAVVPVTPAETIAAPPAS